jgi:hypothetical protein
VRVSDVNISDEAFLLFLDKVRVALHIAIHKQCEAAERMQTDKLENEFGRRTEIPLQALHPGLGFLFEDGLQIACGDVAELDDFNV